MSRRDCKTKHLNFRTNPDRRSSRIPGYSSVTRFIQNKQPPSSRRSPPTCPPCVFYFLVGSKSLPIRSLLVLSVPPPLAPFFPMNIWFDLLSVLPTTFCGKATAHCANAITAAVVIIIILVVARALIFRLNNLQDFRALRLSHAFPLLKFFTHKNLNKYPSTFQTAACCERYCPKCCR